MLRKNDNILCPLVVAWRVQEVRRRLDAAKAIAIVPLEFGSVKTIAHWIPITVAQLDDASVEALSQQIAESMQRVFEEEIDRQIETGMLWPSLHQNPVGL